MKYMTPKIGWDFYLRQVIVKDEIPDILIDIEKIEERSSYPFNDKVRVGEGQGSRDNASKGDVVVRPVQGLNVALPSCHILTR